MRYILTVILALVLVFPALCQVNGTEYYVDIDPGYGKATQVTTALSSDTSYKFVLPLTNYASGFHKLGIRSRDNQGKWSLTSERIFYIVEDKKQDSIVSLQYYFTGTGATDSIYTYAVPAPSQSIDLSFNADLSQLEGNRTYTMHTVAISSTGSRSEEYTKTVTVCNGDPAKAKFSYVLSGTDVSFLNNSIGINNYKWSFGDGKADTLANPLHIYDSVGIYPVKLIATNACNSDTTLDTISILGLKTIYTNVGGNTGSVTVDVRGSGFDSGIQIKLHKDGQPDIIGDTSAIQNEGLLTTTFDLTGKAAGLWDVIALFTNGKTDTLHNGFTVEAGSEPKLWVNMTGDYIIRVGFDQVYTITYGNDGNTDASVVPLIVSGLPLGTQIEVLNPTTKVDSLTSSKDTVQFYTDTTNKNFTVQDTAENMSFKWLYVGNIPARSSGTINVIFHLPLSVQLHSHPKIEVIIGKPLNLSAASNKQSLLEDPEFVDCSRSLATTVITTGVDVLSIDGLAGCIYSSGSFIENTFLSFADFSVRPKHSTGGTISFAVAEFVDMNKSFIEATLDCAEAAGSIALLPETKIAKLLDAMANLALDAMKDPGYVIDCSNTFVEAGSKFFNNIVGNAWDPNEKYGPGDSSSSHYTDSIPLSYAINFTNDTSANLNAQTVTVTDTLNKAYYNYASFGFTSVTIGNSIYLLTSPATSFIHDFDFVSQYGVKARVTATFDTTTGVAQWKFLSIDPVTNQATTNALAGFLPPDVNSPEGQGYVSFTVRQNPALQTGDSIHNKATIVFDYNPPIATKAWQNVFDFISPVSKVQSLPTETPDSVFTVNWSGTDNLSGIQGYDIYYSVNNGPFRVWKSDTSGTSGIFTGQPDSTYRFYSIARDNAGNVEVDKLYAEATTSVTGNGMMLTAKTYLQGPYVAAEGMMTDSLRAKKLIPLTEPYTGLGFTSFTSTLGKTISAGLLDSTGAKAITDWIWVELRSAADSKVVVASRAALIQRSGNIVDTDGVSPVYFNNVLEGSYYVAIRHRNHLGVMSSTAIAFTKDTAATADFTQPTFVTYGTNAQQNSNGVMEMWAGDINGNALVTYNGANNDKNAILSIVGLSTSNNIVTGYFRADCSLDGKVSYNGAANDKNKVLSSVGLLTPNNTITEQLPK